MQVLSTEILLSSVRLDIDLTALIILALFYLIFNILKHKVFTPFLNDMDLREEKTVNTRNKAEELEVKANEIYQRHQENIAQAKKEAQEIRRVLRVEGLDDKESRMNSTTLEANQSYEETRSQIHGQFNSARESALSQVEELARQITTKILGREV